MKNFRNVRSFEGGYSTDIINNIERKNTYQKAISGRLYSNNGVFSFSAAKGSKLIYQNSNIVKYLGYYSFQDEIIVFAKCIKGLVAGGGSSEICEDRLATNYFEINANSTDNVPVSITTEITDNSRATTECYEVETPAENPADFDVQFNCDEADPSTEIDYSQYYNVNSNVENTATCSLNLNQIPLNNELFDDCIISFTLDDDLNLVGDFKWVGMQNWPIDAKITTEGVDENEFYKRVYYTDSFNPRRVVNIKDPSLAYRKGNEFNQILNNVLLQPEIEEIIDGGQLNAMKVLYVSRIISENGQVSEFSSPSEFAKILVETDAITYRGGDVSEETGKAVKIKCNIINPEASSEIQCIALEYEAYGPPTAIRNLGRKGASSEVDFVHYGNESEFADNLTYNDIINYTNSWKYCNDFSSKKNKLIAGGLRNDPLPTAINNLEYLFPLHSWDNSGTPHNCLINPQPWTYRYIDPSFTGDLIYVKQKVYRTISSYGPLTLKFKNIDVPNEIEITFSNLGIDGYTNINTLVIDWLLDQKANNVDFNTFFPNLNIVNVQGQLLLTPVDDLIQTDMANYVFESNNDQYIENFDNDIVFLPATIPAGNKVYGAQSIGFNDGIGIRITYREFKEPLLNQATEAYTGTGNILDYNTPSGEKYCMKGELYRLAFQAFNNDSTRFFAIPLGDVFIPELGEYIKEIDDEGNAVLKSERYVNQSIENGILYGHGIKMHIEVRLSCELQALIPMYQLVYVERTEDNRTILCQGISQPLERLQDAGTNEHKVTDPVRNKWNLPYYGGPTYEQNGFVNYDTYTENDQFTGGDPFRRVMTHRSLMYFDSPDLYYGKISEQYIKTSRLNIVAKLRTDHTPHCIRESGSGLPGYGFEEYPKFSRKIQSPQIEGNINASDLPRYDFDVNETGTTENYFINVSVFAQYQIYNDQFQIENAREFKRGEVSSGQDFNLTNDISNNALCLPCQPWFYGDDQRNFLNQGGNNEYAFTIFGSGIHSPGYNTIIIKTTEDLFTNTFNGYVYPLVDTHIREGNDPILRAVHDTTPLINIFKNNRDSVFGGRTVEAYSKNTYIPLTKTIPVLKSSNNAQYFDVGADTYVTLNIRTKNDAGDAEITKNDYNNHGGARDKGDLENVWKRNGAWMYAVVLESQVEPKDTYQYEAYKVTSTHNFESVRNEIINKAYFNENNVRSYVPKPFKFKDDPNQGHIIAVSDVKLAGEYYDSWTVFKVNNFYAELERNKGDITNLVRQDENVFAIQEQQTAMLYIGTDRIISDSQGNPVNLQQGSGTVVDGHKIVSRYGTSIRRAAVESNYGFCFFDERKIEFVKIIEPLLSKNFLHLNYFELFKTDPIIDTEPYFDHENKETCIRIRTKKSNNFVLSFNESDGFKVFNGELPYNNDIYLMFDEKVYSPITTGSGINLLSSDLHQLNAGDYLNFFGVQHQLKIGLYINADIDKVFQYKQCGIITNLEYPVKSIKGNSNLGYDRLILGTHNWYKIREGIHTVPMINETNKTHNISDIRGNWVYIEITAESLNKNKVNILAVINDLRYSHQ